MTRNRADEITQLIADLGSRDNDTQVRAESRLIKIGKPAVESLIEATRNSDSQVRWRAAWSLGMIGDSRAFGSLAVLLNDSDEDVRHETEEALGHLGDPRAVDLLVEIVANAKLDEDRARHASHYAAAFGTAATAALLRVLESGDLAARRMAAYALGNAGDPNAIGPLYEALDCDGMRHDAAVALGKLGDARVASLLVDYIRSGSEDVHDGDAIWAFGKLVQAGIIPADAMSGFCIPADRDIAVGFKYPMLMSDDSDD